METRTDVLVAEARRLVRFERKKAWMLDDDIDIIRRLADALEAAEGGQHVESKHWVEVGRLRSENLRLRDEVRRLSAQSQSHMTYSDDVGVLPSERKARELAAVIERAWHEGHRAGWDARNNDAMAGWTPSGSHESDAVNALDALTIRMSESEGWVRQ